MPIYKVCQQLMDRVLRFISDISTTVEIYLVS